MLKRTKGRILITLLVITGLAGTVNNTSLSNSERKVIVADLKNSRIGMFDAIKGLSSTQLDFRPTKNSASIREVFYHSIATEKLLWSRLDSAMQQPLRPEKRKELLIPTDDHIQIATAMPLVMPGTFNAGNTKWETIAEASADFKNMRAQHLKYVKTTTSDLRNRFVQLPTGWVDCYQYLLLVAGRSRQHLQEIDKIISDPHFSVK